MWMGYVTFGGNEIVNAERTAAYANNDGASWFHDALKSRTLHRVLGDPAYRSPLQDSDAAWVDKDNPDTFGFYGFYPLDITGIDDSTRVSNIVEYIGDGGNAGRIRHGTRQMVFSGFLAGESDAAVDAGMTWLKAVLLTGSGAGCSDGLCEGTELCFFSAEPTFEAGGGDCGDVYLRTINQVTITNGPLVTTKNRMSDGSHVWQVQFTATANDPFHYGASVPIVENFPHESRTEWHIDGAHPDLEGRNFPEVQCKHRSFQPVFDPACPDLILPPIAPPVRLGCYDPPGSWRRYSFRIPESIVPVWTDLVPIITIRTGTLPLRTMRVRMYADPAGDFHPDDQPCAHCVDFVVSYCPENVVMKIDARTQSVTVQTPGQSRRADGLVFDTDGFPFTWPALSCGIGYVVTVDTLKTAPITNRKRTTLDFALVPRIR